MKRSLALLLLVACGSPSAPPSRAPAAPVTAPTDPLRDSVPIATYGNPALFGPEVEARIGEVLAARGIVWVAVGSLGHTLHVPASRAAEARAALRADAALAGKVHVVDRAARP